MRALRTSLAAATLLGLAPVAATAQTTPSSLLEGFAPKIKGVDYDTPTDKAAVGACKVEVVKNSADKTLGWTLRDGQGKLLRKFIDTNLKPTQRGSEPKPTTHLDQWSYFKDGFEVYRESDTDEDGYPDEVRWLNTAGTRIGSLAFVNKGYHLTGWKRLSAEEASKVLVQALVLGDADLLNSVLATPEELKEVGAPKAELDQVAKSTTNRRALVDALRKGLKGWAADTEWSRFDGSLPHVIPADPALDLAKEILLYENAIVFAQAADPTKNTAPLAYLQASDVVKIGETWKFTELPRAVDPDNQQPLAALDGIRARLVGGDVTLPPENVKYVEAVKALTEFDAKNAPHTDGDNKQIAEYNHGRLALLRAVVAASDKPEERLTYNKEIVNSLAAAYQTDMYPKGLEIIAQVGAKEGGRLQAFAAYRSIMADFALKAAQPGADFLALQKETAEKLQKFVEENPKSEETAEAYFQLATVAEFNRAEDDARKYFKILADLAPETDLGKKAAGSLKRLDLVGKTLDLSGKTGTGKVVGAASYKGKALLVVFWSSSAELFRKDLGDLNKLYAKYQPKGFEILGVNLDTDNEALAAFLKENPLSWPQIVEPGGMDSRLANEYGIIASPTMILTDSSGKVVNRGVHSVAELQKYLDKMLSGGPALSLGGR